jgi:hypothetical protein
MSAQRQNRAFSAMSAPHPPKKKPVAGEIGRGEFEMHVAKRVELCSCEHMPQNIKATPWFAHRQNLGEKMMEVDMRHLSEHHPIFLRHGLQ